MDKKQKAEWLDLFAEAFHGVVMPVIKPMQKDIKILKKDVGVLKKDVQTLKGDVIELKHDIKGIKDSLAESDATIRNHGVRISRLEASSP